MKAVKIIAIIVAAVLLFAGISFLFFKPLYYRFFYLWNRISGTISITIDGEMYDIKESDITGSHEKNKIRIGFSKNDNGAKVSMRGSSYGPYTLLINVEGVDSPLELVIYQYNWWNVVEFDLNITIDHANDKITFKSTAQVLNEEGKKVPEDKVTRAKLSDGEFKHYIVSI